MSKQQKHLAKPIADSPEIRRLAKLMAEYERLDAAVRKARQSDPYKAYVYRVAKTGNPAAREELRKRAGPSDAEVREHATRMLKSSSGEIRRLAQTELDQLNGWPS